MKGLLARRFQLRRRRRRLQVNRTRTKGAGVGGWRWKAGQGRKLERRTERRSLRKHKKLRDEIIAREKRRRTGRARDACKNDDREKGAERRCVYGQKKKKESDRERMKSRNEGRVTVYVGRWG